MSSYIPHNPAEPADRHAAPAVPGGRRVTLKAVHQWSADTTGNALGRFDPQTADPGRRHHGWDLGRPALL
jgi:hypothetical protein